MKLIAVFPTSLTYAQRFNLKPPFMLITFQCVHFVLDIQAYSIRVWLYRVFVGMAVQIPNVPRLPQIFRPLLGLMFYAKCDRLCLSRIRVYCREPDVQQYYEKRKYDSSEIVKLLSALGLLISWIVSYFYRHFVGLWAGGSARFSAYI